MHHSPRAGAGSEIVLKLRWGVMKMWDSSRMAVAIFTACLPVAAHTCGG